MKSRTYHNDIIPRQRSKIPRHASELDGEQCLTKVHISQASEQEVDSQRTWLKFLYPKGNESFVDDDPILIVAVQLTPFESRVLEIVTLLPTGACSCISNNLILGYRQKAKILTENPEPHGRLGLL